MKRVIITLFVSLFVISSFGQWKYRTDLSNSQLNVWGYKDYEVGDGHGSYSLRYATNNVEDPAKQLHVLQFSYVMFKNYYGEQIWKSIHQQIWNQTTLDEDGNITFSRKIKYKYEIIGNDNAIVISDGDDKYNLEMIMLDDCLMSGIIFIDIHPNILKYAKAINIDAEDPFITNYFYKFNISLEDFNDAYNYLDYMQKSAISNQTYPPKINI